MTTTYLTNRSPSPLLGDKSPYEMLYNTKPLYSLLKTFRCLCYATNTAPHKSKFTARAHKFIFLGFPFGIKGYKHIFKHNLFLFQEMSHFMSVHFFSKILLSFFPHQSQILFFLFPHLILLLIPLLFLLMTPSLLLMSLHLIIMTYLMFLLLEDPPVPKILPLTYKIITAS